MRLSIFPYLGEDLAHRKPVERASGLPLAWASLTPPPEWPIFHYLEAWRMGLYVRGFILFLVSSALLLLWVVTAQASPAWRH